MTDQVAVNDRRAPYTATNGQTVFDIDFPLDNVDYIVVYKNGVAMDPEDFTVDLDALTVTLDAGAALDDSIVLEGQRLIKRITGYPLRGGLSSALLNVDMNALIYILQEMRRDLDRAISLNVSEDTVSSPDLPLLDEGKAILWGSAGLENSTDNFNDVVTLAGASAAAAAASEAAAASSEAAAASSAATASAQAGAAASSATAAAGSATTAATQATNAASSATAAAGSATTAATQATNAASSATAAAGSATTASTQATNAASSATAAAGSATTASTQATNAASSATAADGSATTASTQATNAATSASAAATSQSAAASSAAAAAASAAAGLYETVVAKTFSDSPIAPAAGNEGTLYMIDTSGGNVVVNLSALSTYGQDMKLAFVKMTGDANTVTINRGGSDTINGSSSKVLAVQYEVNILVGDSASSKWVTATQTSTISDDAVTFAKMQNIATDTLIGRDTAGTGDPEAITVGGGLEFTGSGGIQIAADGVTNAKLNNMAANTVKSNATASSDNPTDVAISANQVLGRLAANIVPIDIATTANYQANASDKVMKAETPWAAAGAVGLTDAATIAMDCATGINFSVTLGGNRTLGAPTNVKDAQCGYIKFTQDGTGTRTLAFNAAWKNTSAIQLSTAAGTIDVLHYEIVGSTPVVTGLIKGI